MFPSSIDCTTASPFRSFVLAPTWHQPSELNNSATGRHHAMENRSIAGDHPWQVIDVDEIAPASPNSNTRPATSANVQCEDDLTNPFVDIHQQFTLYNQKHFGGQITNTYVEYSTRMTLCAGTCTFKGARGGCRIALSEPLLKYRSRADLLSTLLHEMIHAFLFVTEGVAVRDGVDGHGPKFLAHADRINRVEQNGIHITPYHSFSDEVDLYRVHHWQCSSCKMCIKRAMNRAPAPRDPFWSQHQHTCGGDFVKIKGPDPKPKSVRPPKLRAVAVDSIEKEKQYANNVMRTRRIDDMLTQKPQPKPNSKLPCPVCNRQIEKLDLNNHLDSCLSPDFFSQPDPAKKKQKLSNEEPIVIDLGTQSDDHIEQIQVQSRADVHILDDSPPKVDSTTATDRATSEVGAAYIQQPQLFAPKSNSRAREEALMSTIGNYSKLVDLAIEPASVDESCMAEICPTVPSISLKSTEESERIDIKSLLDSFMRGESAYEAQERTKRKLKRWLKPDSNVDLSLQNWAAKLCMTEKECFNMIQRKCKREGGCLVFTDELHVMLENRTVEKEMRATATSIAQADHTQRTGTAHMIQQSHPPWQSHLKRNITTGTSSRKDVPEFGETKFSPPQQTIRMGNCPVCDLLVSRSELESHVNTCLNETDVAPHIFDEGDHNRQPVPEISTPTVPASRDHSTKENTVEPNSQCPVCDTTLPRSQLDGHLTVCMMSTGLADAF